MGRLEDRLRKLEEADDRVGYAAAIQRLEEEDFVVFHRYLRRWEAEGDERGDSPDPTPEEAVVLRKFHDLRRQAVAEGWATRGTGSIDDAYDTVDYLSPAKTAPRSERGGARGGGSPCGLA